MMATFRPYTVKEVRQAAQAYGLDPDFAEAIYAVESSRGTNPKALVARQVKRKRDSTFVRGPFQLEDDTTSDLIRENKLGNVNVDDPDTHLDLAMRQMRKLQDRYRGDPVQMAQAYLGRGTDELGTTSEGYGNKIIAEMQRLKGDAIDSTATRVPELAMTAPADDLFGMPSMAAPRDSMLGMGGSIERDPLGLPVLFSDKPRAPAQLAADNNSADLDRYIQSLVDEEFDGKDFANAA